MEQILVKIVKGVYGLEVGMTVVGKSANDPPFFMDKDKAERLFKKGVAEPVRPDENPEGYIYGVDKIPSGKKADDLEEMTLAELKEVGEKYGVKHKFGTKKSDFIEQIQAAMQEDKYAEEESEEEAEEEIPDGELPFTYDPAEVVK